MQDNEEKVLWLVKAAGNKCPAMKRIHHALNGVVSHQEQSCDEAKRGSGWCLTTFSELDLEITVDVRSLRAVAVLCRTRRDRATRKSVHSALLYSFKNTKAFRIGVVPVLFRIVCGALNLVR